MSLPLLLATLFSFALTAAHAADGPAVHGMLMFGEKAVYLSHLPMFHNPHHYQGILKVEMRPDAEKIFFNDQKAHPGEIYTYVPEPAVLPDIFAAKVPLKGDVYRGHFERGGVPIVQGVTSKIIKVIHFRKFDSQAVRPPESTYLLFGEPGDSWIAHFISLKPDFDHIASVHVATNEVGATVLKIPGVSDTKPLESKQGVNAQTINGQAIKLENIKTKYLEFGDLQM